MATSGLTRRQRRVAFLSMAVVAAAMALTLVFGALGEHVLYFYSPSDAASQQVPPGKTVNIGGLVKVGTVQRQDHGGIRFAVTDNTASVIVVYGGILPDLFREGQGVVATGSFRTDRVFEASSILAKHDERYMTPEVAEALKKKGVWRNRGGSSQR